MSGVVWDGPWAAHTTCQHFGVMILLRTFIQADQKKSGPSVQYTTSGCFEPPRDPPKRPLGVWSRKNVLANESSHGRGCTFLLKRF